jgi:hypothetical protein
MGALIPPCATICPPHHPARRVVEVYGEGVLLLGDPA